MALLEGPPVIAEDLLEGVFVDPLSVMCHGRWLYHTLPLGSTCLPSLPCAPPWSLERGTQGQHKKEILIRSRYINVPRFLRLSAVRAARPRASDVLPVPGSPTSRIIPWSGRSDRCILGRRVKFKTACESRRSFSARSRTIASHSAMKSSSGSRRASKRPVLRGIVASLPEKGTWPLL